MVELNQAVIEQLREAVGSQAFAEIASDFVSDTKRLEARLRRALAEGDPDDARACAHELRGLAATFGADGLVASCVAAQTAGEAALREVGQTEKLCASAREAVERFVRAKGLGAA
jgi:HPt (histidine-containing phosphotransfer) domain-containing protein